MLFVHLLNHKKMKYAPLLIFLFVCNFTYSQSKNKAVALAQYQLKHIYDTLNTTQLTSEKYDLFLSKSSSVFKSNDKKIQDSLMKVQFSKTKIMAPPSGKRANSEEIFIYQNEKKLYTNVIAIIGKHVVERSYPQISWKITQERKIIAGYKSQKAIGTYHGRRYTAWFTTELPFNAGPWKLTGLPGLILEAVDDTKRIKFEFLSFKQLPNSNETINWSEKVTVLPWKDYVNICKAIEDDPMVFMKNKMGANVSFNSDVKLNQYNPMLPKKGVNFPLEALEYYTIK